MPEDSEPDWYAIYCWCQRAKRKNRVAQYKRTIAKLNRELAMFTDNFDLIAEALVALSEHSDDATRNACADLLINLAH